MAHRSLSYMCFCYLAALAACLGSVLALEHNFIHANSTHFVRQETTDMMVPYSMLYSKHAKAILMLKEQQTFCQATIISSTAAVLAASCFEYNDNMQADITQYNLAVEAADPAVVLRTQISNITPHPNYDPESFANNIAVVRFTEISTTMSYNIDNIPSLWQSFLHVHYSLNVDNTQWNEPKLEDVPLGDQNECAAASSLFKAYPSDFICTVGKVSSMFHDGCSLPYKFILGHFEVGTGMLGFYSHSALTGNTPYCDNETMYNFYILIAHYIPWINQLVDPDVYAGNRNNAAPDAVDATYSMSRPATGSTSGKTIHSLFNFGDVLPIIKQQAIASPHESKSAHSEEPAGQVGLHQPDADTITQTETETTTEKETETATEVSTADPVTVTSTDTVINTETTTNVVSTTQETTTTFDHTTTVSETVTTTSVSTATATTTEVITTTLIQSITGTVTDIQIDTQAELDTSTSVLTTTVVSSSECPVVVCDTPMEVSEVTVTVTETEQHDETIENTEFSTVMVTVTMTESAQTITETAFATMSVTVSETVTHTAAEGQSVDPITVMLTVTETLVVSETETIEGDIESVFATVTVVTAAESSESSETETGAETEKSSLPPWLIGLIVLIVVAVLLLMVLFGYLYYRWRKRQREQYLASLVRPVSYPEEYLNPSGKEKDSKAYYIQNSYNHPEERQSRYNSKGSYVGYI